MSLQPRPYQQQAIEAAERGWARGLTAPAIVMATGLGKTVVFAHTAARFAERTRRRVVVLAHRTELVDQARAKLAAVMPELQIGKVMGNANQTLAPIVVASPQTLRTLNRRRQLMNVGLVIADECHHYAAPSFREVLEHFREQGAVLLGVTATMSRSDKRSLGEVWQEVVFQRDIAFGQQHGFLVLARGKRVRVDDLDMRTVKRTSTGEYQAEAQGEALTASMAPKRIAEALTEHAPDGRTVAFAPTIGSAQAIAEDCRTAGFATETVHYKTPPGERRRILEQHESGALQVVTNAMVLTEGWDNPACDTAVIARQTNSNALYTQMVGRVLRPYFGKTSALILDVVGASERHTLQAQIELFGEEYAEQAEREPCHCSLGELCSCPRERCTSECMCAPNCQCEWPEQLELEDEGTLHVDGKIVAEDVDLFHGSENMWMVTAGGTHFLDAGERFIAIIPHAEQLGTWDVVSTSRYVPRAHSRWLARAVPDLGFAQAYAEADITPAERRMARKGSGWRLQRPSIAQVRYAHGLGLQAGGCSASELASKISIAEASARFDSAVQALRMRWEHSS